MDNIRDHKFTDEFLRDLGRFVIDHAFTVTVNMNDTFYYACADCESLGVHDLPDIIDKYKRYGSAGLDAYVAAKRKISHGDCIKGYYPKEYWDNFNKALEEWSTYEVYPGAREEGNPFDED